MSKGSGRRPMFIDPGQFDERWLRTFPRVIETERMAAARARKPQESCQEDGITTVGTKGSRSNTDGHGVTTPR